MQHEKPVLDLDNIDAVIFDMDGVVTRSAGAHAAAWKRMFDDYLKEHARKHGEKFIPFDITNDYSLYVDGKPRYEGAQSFLKSRNIDIPFGSPDDAPEKETVCGLGNRKNAYFQQYLKENGADAYKSTVDFIKELKSRGKPVAVISSSKNAMEVLDAAGVKDLFDAIVEGRASVSLGLKGKPEPDIFLQAARELNVFPQRSAMVEDALAGVQAGVAGDFAIVIGVDRANNTEEMRKLGADIIVKDISELKVLPQEHTHDAASLPSALQQSEKIIQQLCRGMPALFLDYNGTLKPLVDAQESQLFQRLRTALRTVSERWPVVIMSKGAVSSVREQLGLETIVYASSHGFTVGDPGEPFAVSLGRHFLPAINNTEKHLEDRLGTLPGVHIRRLPYSVTVKYDEADTSVVAKVEQYLSELSTETELKLVRDGNKAEFRPDLNWDKGRTLLHLARTVHVDGSRLVPLFIGDDITDEDAFKAIEGYGIGVLIGPEHRPTEAAYILQDARQAVLFLEELAKNAEKDVSRDTHTFSYEGYDPASEQLREVLCATGNGYFVTRAAAPESPAGEYHYPGTYIAGIYNRLTSDVSGHTIENESLVNVPNWLPLTFRIEGGEWFDLASVNILDYRQELDTGRGVLTRSVRFTDVAGRHTRLTERRFVHIQMPHVAALETTLVAEDWEGNIEVRSAIDGNVENTLVKRYRQLNNHHLLQVDNGSDGSNIIWLLAETNQSHIHIAEAVRTRVFIGEERYRPERRVLREEGYIAQEFTVPIKKGRLVRVEKIAALYNSRDRGITESSLAAREEVRFAADFAGLLASHITGWSHLWEIWHITVDTESMRMAQILNLHIFHLLQTVSPNTISLDAGIPPRGLHGEAYRGLIMWDELFIFPLLNLRIPDITKSLLSYRYRRLSAARRAALTEGYSGAMFPWQSGSNGREEAQTLHLNPKSGRWIPDNSQLERHINLAVGYNVWQYYQVSGDIEFMAYYGTEILLELARFWASKCRYNHSLDRYEIHKVMGPDEFHDRYPGVEEPGIDNNAYTNVMTVWVMCRALEALEIIPHERRSHIWENLVLRKEELDRWNEISHKMLVPFHDGDIISQFEGYGDLLEFDWTGYRKKYGDIHRLDRILEAEGDTPNRYKVSKQADVLMLFYLFSADEMKELFDRIGYPFEHETIPRNIEYYLERTSHGSTLSRVVHSWVLARSRREVSWHLFQDALESDVLDIQGGTTHEGIHLGAMAGTVDIIQRAYTGIETRGDVLRFNPVLPKGLKSVEFEIRYRGHWLEVRITGETLKVASRPQEIGPIEVALGEDIRELKPGNTLEFQLQLQPV